MGLIVFKLCFKESRYVFNKKEGLNSSKLRFKIKKSFLKKRFFKKDFSNLISTITYNLKNFFFKNFFKKFSHYNFIDSLFFFLPIINNRKLFRNSFF